MTKGVHLRYFSSKSPAYQVFSLLLQKDRILLMVALTQTTDNGETREMFGRY